MSLPEEFINILEKQGDVRIFVDIRADGTGHVQSSLDIAHRLRTDGYTGPLTFVLGTPLLDVKSAFGGRGVNFNDEWIEKKQQFDELLKTRDISGPHRTLSEQAFIFDDINADIKSVLEDYAPDGDSEKLDPDTTAMISALQKHLSSSLPSLLQTELSLCGASDRACGALDKKTRSLSTLSLQPSNWERGFPPGIIDKSGITPFSSDIKAIPMRRVTRKNVAAAVRPYLSAPAMSTSVATSSSVSAAHSGDEHYHSLIRHIANAGVSGTRIVAYNSGVMNNSERTMTNLLSVIKDSHKCCTILSVNSEGQHFPIDKKSLQAKGWSTVPLEDMSPDTDFGTHVIIDCKYLPSAVFDFALANSELVACEGPGTAVKAMLLGTPVLHSSKNAPMDAYPIPVDKSTESTESTESTATSTTLTSETKDTATSSSTLSCFEEARAMVKGLAADDLDPSAYETLFSESFSAGFKEYSVQCLESPDQLDLAAAEFLRLKNSKATSLSKSTIADDVSEIDSDDDSDLAPPSL